VAPKEVEKGKEDKGEMEERSKEREGREGGTITRQQ